MTSYQLIGFILLLLAMGGTYYLLQFRLPPPKRHGWHVAEYVLVISICFLTFVLDAGLLILFFESSLDQMYLTAYQDANMYFFLMMFDLFRLLCFSMPVYCAFKFISISCKSPFKYMHIVRGGITGSVIGALITFIFIMADSEKQAGLLPGYSYYIFYTALGTMMGFAEIAALRLNSILRAAIVIIVVYFIDTIFRIILPYVLTQYYELGNAYLAIPQILLGVVAVFIALKVDNTSTIPSGEVESAVENHVHAGQEEAS